MSGHVVPLRMYFGIFAALMALTAATVWAAFQDFGILNTVVALGIAILKATLVILYFMHVRYSSGLVRISAAIGFVFLVILIGYVAADVASRGWMPAPVPIQLTPLHS
jgi:cytochrome c oxidase subunit IV